LNLRPPGPESGAGSEVNAKDDMLSVQMHWGKRLGLSSGSSEFQEKMRLGDICRLGFALWILNEFCVQMGIPLNQSGKKIDENARSDSFQSGEGSSTNTDPRAAELRAPK